MPYNENDFIVDDEQETLTDEDIDGIGDYIDEHYGEDNELTDEEFNDIIFSYYDVYMQLQGKGSENP